MQAQTIGNSPISQEQEDSLFWLGRYVERVYSTLLFFNRIYDRMIDKDGFAYQDFCERLAIPNIYADQDDFVTRYLFDKANPDSVLSNMSRAYDNALVLRNYISSQTLSYVQMALDTLSMGSKTNTHCLLNILVIDHLLAFWGSLDDNCDDVKRRNIVKAGKHLERLDMALRLGYPRPLVEQAFLKLRRRLNGLDIAYDPAEIGAVARILADGKELERNPKAALDHVESIMS